MDVPTSRQWMYNRVHPSRVGFQDAFLMGVDEFVNHACRLPVYLSERRFRCPCVKCSNRRLEIVDVVKVHLYQYGFMPNYYYWTSHGEVSPVVPRAVYPKLNDQPLRQEHKRRKRIATGKEQSLPEPFLKTHKKKDSGEFVDKRSADVVAEYNRMASSRSSNASADDATDEILPKDQNGLWLEAVGGVNKKGRIFCGGSETPKICSSSSEKSASTTPSSSWLNPDIEHEIKRRVTKAVEELQQDYRKEIEELKKLIISSRNQEQDQQDDEASN